MEGARAATTTALARAGREAEAIHLLDASLVDPAASEFPIDDVRSAQILARARELSERAERLVVTCSVYNGVVPWLAHDLGISVQRSDAAGARALLATEGPVGLLVSYPPTRPIVEDYVSEILAGAEQNREIRTSGDVRMLQDCGVLFLTQYTMNPQLETFREIWGSRPLISALDATIAALFPR